MLAIPFPAGAGINRKNMTCIRDFVPVPRRRGDQPLMASGREPVTTRSPQARGSTAVAKIGSAGEIPFPAGAGINRTSNATLTVCKSVPRRRGDQPVI